MLNHLLTFITVSDMKNFTKAAQSLHLSQSAVTLAIKKLEKEYGAKLLDRTNKYVRLTRAGEILYHHGKEIAAHESRIRRLIDDLSNTASGDLQIGSSFTFGEYILPKLLSSFSQTYPNIKPEIAIHNTSRVITRLSRGELDLGIIEGTIKDDNNLMITPFAKDEMVVIVSANHRLANCTEIALEELADETWIIREEGSGTRQRIDQLFSHTDFSPATIREFGSSQIIKESVEADLGISLISKFIIRKEMQLGTIRPLRIKQHPIIRDFFFVIQKTAFHTKSTQLFLQFLKDYTLDDLLVGSDPK